MISDLRNVRVVETQVEIPDVSKYAQTEDERTRGGGGGGGGRLAFKISL